MTSLELITCIGHIEDELFLEAKQMENSQHRTAPHSIKRGLLIAVVAALLLLLVGCAVGYLFFYPGMIETILGENGRQTYIAETVRGLYEPGGERTQLDSYLAKKYIAPHIFPAEGTISEGETTLTALSYIVDRTSCTAAVYLKLENPPEYEIHNSGRILFSWNGKWNGWFIYPSAVGQDAFIGRCYIDAASTTGDTLYCVIAFSCEPTCTGLELQIGNAPDKITLSFPEKSGFPSVMMENGSIQITPFGMKVSASLLNQDDAPFLPVHREAAIQYANGDEYLLLHTGFGDADFVGYTYGMALNTALEDYVFIFNRVVDTKNISAFRINDRIYPIQNVSRFH